MIYLIYLVISFILGLLFTLISREIAYRHNIVDRPDNMLKKHEKVTPYLGGLAIYLSFVSSILILSLIGLINISYELIGLIISSTIVFILGLIDDIKHLTPRDKFLGQLIAAIVFIHLVGKTSLFNIELVDFMFTLLWLVGVSNAVNLIDIMDGLAAGVVSIIALNFGCLSIMTGSSTLGIISLLLAGSCIGFLKYNFNPAIIFMGDAGSLFIGFIIATIPVMVFWDTPNVYHVLLPILISIVPIGEIILLIIMRKKAGRSVFSGSRDHFALRLRKLGFTVKQITIVTYIFSFIVGVINICLYVNNFGIKNIVIISEFIIILSVGIWLSKIDMTVDNENVVKNYKVRTKL